MATGTDNSKDSLGTELAQALQGQSPAEGETPQDGFGEVDRRMMQMALDLAKKAARRGEVPVGAVLVDETGRVIGAGFNQSIGQNDPTAHAEMLAIRQAAAALGNYRLTGTTLYVSLEPCAMCSGALVWARVKKVVFAAPDPKAGALGGGLDILAAGGINHRPEVAGGLLAGESAAILRDFFAARR